VGRVEHKFTIGSRVKVNSHMTAYAPFRGTGLRQDGMIHRSDLSRGWGGEGGGGEGGGSGRWAWGGGLVGGGDVGGGAVSFLLLPLYSFFKKGDEVEVRK